MAQPDIIRGTYFVLALGDGATPTEVFTPLCGFNTRTFRAQVNTNDTFTRDCADPENVPIRRIIATGKQWSITGEGQINRANIESVMAEINTVSNWRFLWTEPEDDEVFQGYFEGPFMLVNFEITGGDENYATFSITLESDGEVIFTEVTPA